MKIKDRIEALFLASNRSLTLEDIHELLNINALTHEILHHEYLIHFLL